MDEPIIILGAARSGTKMLRGILAQLGGWRAVPWDVSYVWRYGNERVPDDALAADLATPRIRRFIRRRLRRMAAGQGPREAAYLEKTVGNTLRVPFVKEVFPNARYIFLVRDGRDVTESAIRCWTEPPRVGYVLKKLRSFPWLSCGQYGWDYARRLTARACGWNARLSSWGPRYPGIDQDVANLSLPEVCARQWLTCIASYEKHREVLPAKQLLEVRYEDLVRSPVRELGRMASFLEFPWNPRSVAKLGITSANVGKFKRLPRFELEQIVALQRDALARWGYERADQGAA